MNHAISPVAILETFFVLVFCFSFEITTFLLLGVAAEAVFFDFSLISITFWDRVLSF